MKVTIRHRFEFGRALPAGLEAPEAWDALRDGQDGFAMPASRDEWEALAAGVGLEARARAIAAVVEDIGARRVCSYGAGAGLLEWNLRRVAPQLQLECTDFAPLTVARLGGHLEGVPVVRHELRTEQPRDADLHLLYRVDTELSDDDWATVFARFHDPVLVVASELLGLRSALRELGTRALHPRAVPAGWIRTEEAFRALWSRSHYDRRVELEGLVGYVLTRPQDVRA